MPDYLKKQWNLLGGAAECVATAIGSFWHTPPAADLEAGQLGAFGKFFLTLAVGILLIPAHLYRKRKHTPYWVAAAIVVVTLIPVAYFTYTHLANAWTCPFDDTRVVVGSDADLNEHGKTYRADHPTLSVEKVVWYHGGHSEDVWNREALERRRLILGIFYVAVLPLFAAGMISVTQASYCVTRR